MLIQAWAENYIANAPVVYIEGSFYITGGEIDFNFGTTISRFDATQRPELEILRKSRNLRNLDRNCIRSCTISGFL